MEKKSSRKVILIVMIAIIVAAFAVHYALVGQCDGTNAVFDYFIGTFAPQVGNSFIVFTLLWWFGWPMAQKMVAERKSTIEREIDECAKLKAEAERVAQEAEAKMARLDDEKAEMKEAYEASTKAECAQIREDADRQSERMAADAEVSFELQANTARKAFEREVMAKSLDRARENIARRLSSDPSLRDKLIEQSIASFEL